MLKDYETLESIQDELFNKHKTTVQELNFYLEVFRIIDVPNDKLDFIIKYIQKGYLFNETPEEIKEMLIQDEIIKEEVV